MAAHGELQLVVEASHGLLGDRSLGVLVLLLQTGRLTEFQRYAYTLPRAASRLGEEVDAEELLREAINRPFDAVWFEAVWGESAVAVAQSVARDALTSLYECDQLFGWLLARVTAAGTPNHADDDDIPASDRRRSMTSIQAGLGPVEERESASGGGGGAPVRDSLAAGRGGLPQSVDAHRRWPKRGWAPRGARACERRRGGAPVRDSLAAGRGSASERGRASTLAQEGLGPRAEREPASGGGGGAPVRDSLAAGRGSASERGRASTLAQEGLGPRAEREPASGGGGGAPVRDSLAAGRGSASDPLKILAEHAFLRGRPELCEALAAGLPRAERHAFHAAAAYQNGDQASAQRWLDALAENDGAEAGVLAERGDARRDCSRARSLAPDVGAAAPLLALLLFSRGNALAQNGAKRWLASRALGDGLAGAERGFRTLLRYAALPESECQRLDVHQLGAQARGWELLLLGLTVHLFLKQDVTRASWAIAMTRAGARWLDAGYSWFGRQALLLGRALSESHFEREYASLRAEPVARGLHAAARRVCPVRADHTQARMGARAGCAGAAG